MTEVKKNRKRSIVRKLKHSSLWVAVKESDNVSYKTSMSVRSKNPAFIKQTNPANAREMLYTVQLMPL